MGKPLDLTGQRFGKWTVVSMAVSPTGYEHQRFWLCRCDCGHEQVRKGAQMRYAQKRGVEQSCQRCGALSHGQTGTPEHRAWVNMHDRCRRPACQAFPHYGGRGIKVCERWNSFESFFGDMGPRPTTRHSLDRIDNDGHYSPENCRWTTSKTQNRNRRDGAMITFDGKTKRRSEWSEDTGVSHATLRQRIVNLGWSAKEALTTPTGHTCNWRNTPHKDATKFQYNGMAKTLREWESETGIRGEKIRRRLFRGWSIERALTTP